MRLSSLSPLASRVSAGVRVVWTGVRRGVRARITAGERALDLCGPVGEEFALSCTAAREKLAAETIEVHAPAEVGEERYRPVREIADLRPARCSGGGATQCATQGAGAARALRFGGRRPA